MMEKYIVVDSESRSIIREYNCYNDATNFVDSFNAEGFNYYIYMKIVGMP
jgi:hypothetical protein